MQSIPGNQHKMGQVNRMMSYDRAANERNAVSAMNFLGASMKWHRLDDGVMGGKSETLHKALGINGSSLHFAGFINTDGGGFASIRSPLPASGLPKDMEALRLRIRGDGKTYKVLLSDGNKSTGSPLSRTPTWQCDLPTKKAPESCTNTSDNNEKKGEEFFEEVVLPIKDFKPSFGGRSSSRPSEEEMQKYELDLTEMRQIGFMLSLKLSDGSPNPPETFGEGAFDFSLHIDSITSVSAPN